MKKNTTIKELEKEAKIRSKKARNVAAQEFSDQFFVHPLSSHGSCFF